MGRVRAFAAPFVVTAALSGCKEPGDQAPRPEPRTAVDARVATARVDAHVAPAPDASGLPAALAGVTTVKLAHGGFGCKAFPSNEAVRCPPEGATLSFDDADLPIAGNERSRIRYDLWKGRCLERVGGCPPREEATCNPPPPRPVPCPEDKLPTLAPGLEPTKRTKGRCYWHAGDVDLEVKCP